MPESYWQPFLGDVCGLRPCDLADLTPQKMDACWDYMEAKFGG